MPQILPTIGLICLYGFIAPAYSHWHIHYDGKFLVNTTANNITIARLEALLPHYRHNRGIRLRFTFPNHKQVEQRWQVLTARLPALISLDYYIYNNPDTDVLRIDLVQEAPPTCPAHLIIKDPELPIKKAGLTVDGTITLALSAQGSVRIRQQNAPTYIALAYDSSTKQYIDLRGRSDIASDLQADGTTLFVGLQRLYGKDGAQAKEQLRQRLKKSAEASKAMSLSPVPAEIISTKMDEKTKEWCIIKLYRL